MPQNKIQLQINKDVSDFIKTNGSRYVDLTTDESFYQIPYIFKHIDGDIFELIPIEDSLKTIK